MQTNSSGTVALLVGIICSSVILPHCAGREFARDVRQGSSESKELLGGHFQPRRTRPMATDTGSAFFENPQQETPADRFRSSAQTDYVSRGYADAGQGSGNFKSAPSNDPVIDLPSHVAYTIGNKVAAVVDFAAGIPERLYAFGASVATSLPAALNGNLNFRQNSGLVEYQDQLGFRQDVPQSSQSFPSRNVPQNGATLHSSQHSPASGVPQFGSSNTNNVQSYNQQQFEAVPQPSNPFPSPSVSQFGSSSTNALQSSTSQQHGMQPQPSQVLPSPNVPQFGFSNANVPQSSSSQQFGVQPDHSRPVEPFPTGLNAQDSTKSSTSQNNFPLLVQSNGQQRPVFLQSHNELYLPTAEGGVEPPHNFVSNREPVHVENFSIPDISIASSTHTQHSNSFSSQATNNKQPQYSQKTPTTGQTSVSGSNKPRPVINPDVSRVVDGIQEFGIDMVARIDRTSAENVVFSPVSIASLLSLLALATNGQSKIEIERALKVPSKENYHNLYGNIVDRLNYDYPGVSVTMKSRLFLQDGIMVFNQFIRQAQVYYDCNVESLNFLQKPMDSMNAINRWITLETKGKITDFLVSPFTPDTRFVAVNTVYFNGDWENPFPEYVTTERDFDTGNEVIKVPMMTNVFDTYHTYHAILNVDVVSLPYRGGEFSMIIILPREPPQRKSIVQLEEQLTTYIYNQLIRNMTLKTVSVSLPRMRLGMKTNLIRSLTNLNIHSIFSPNTADFSSLTNERPLHVGTIMHEAIVDVNEKGTSAAAVSIASLDRMGGYQRVDVNKNAIAIIRDNKTGLTLFYTRIVKPELIPDDQTQQSFKFG